MTWAGQLSAWNFMPLVSRMKMRRTTILPCLFFGNQFLTVINNLLDEYFFLKADEYLSVRNLRSNGFLPFS